MRHPPYHLRPNKAIDRVLLIEIIKRLHEEIAFVPKAYVGLGGPFLDDFRLFAQAFPDSRLVCVESNRETAKRQNFHKASRRISFRRTTLADFITDEIDRYRNLVVWADYPKLAPDRLGDIEALMGKVQIPSVVKVTLPAVGARRGIEFTEDLNRVRAQYGRYLIENIEEDELTGSNFVKPVYRMIQAATQLGIPPQQSACFQPIQALWYSENTPIVSVTGVMCETDDRQKIREYFSSWDLGNPNWEPLHRVDVPVLSVKERLQLERYLPMSGDRWVSLRNALGYRLDDTNDASQQKYKQYRRFHQYYPLFGRISL